MIRWAKISSKQIAPVMMAGRVKAEMQAEKFQSVVPKNFSMRDVT